MAIHQTETSLDSQVLYVLTHYKEVALEKIETYLGETPQNLTEERALALWECLEGRRDWDDTPQIDEVYGALLLGPILQLEGWIKAPAPAYVPSGMVFGKLVHIGLLIADTTAQMKARQNKTENATKTDEDAERAILSDIARRAVSHRQDQRIKPDWIEHCARAVQSGAKIERLGDLLDIPGYDPAVMKIQQATLRRWASEVGVIFKSGRPKTN